MTQNFQQVAAAIRAARKSAGKTYEELADQIRRNAGMPEPVVEMPAATDMSVSEADLEKLRADARKTEGDRVRAELSSKRFGKTAAHRYAVATYDLVNGTDAIGPFCQAMERLGIFESGAVHLVLLGSEMANAAEVAQHLRENGIFKSTEKLEAAQALIAGWLFKKQARAQADALFDIAEQGAQVAEVELRRGRRERAAQEPW